MSSTHHLQKFCHASHKLEHQHSWQDDFETRSVQSMDIYYSISLVPKERVKKSTDQVAEGKRGGWVGGGGEIPLFVK